MFCKMFYFTCNHGLILLETITFDFFVFNRAFFPELRSGLGRPLKSELFGIVTAVFLQTGRAYCHPTNITGNQRTALKH